MHSLKNRFNMSSEDKSENQEVVDEPKDEAKEKPKKSRRGKKAKANEELEELKIQLAESKDKHLRLFAEFENFKKRNTKERLELMSTAARGTIEKILPVLDDFDRAKKAAEDESSSEQLSDGVLMVYNKLHSIMSGLGVTAMETNGETFDAELHEALTEIPAPSDDMKGKIIDTIEKGYYLNDKIIRFAKVVVGK